MTVIASERIPPVFFQRTTILFLAILLAWDIRLPFFDEKMRFFDLGFIALIFWSIIQGIRNRRFFHETPLALPLGGLMAAAGISLWGIHDPVKGAIQWTGVCYLGCLYMIGAHAFSFVKNSMLFFMKCWVWIQVIIGFFSITGFFFPQLPWANQMTVVFESYPNLHSFPRLRGLSHNPNAFALDLYFAILFALWIWIETQKNQKLATRWIWALLILISAQLLTISRTIAVAFLAGWILVRLVKSSALLVRLAKTVFLVGWLFFLPLMTALTIWTVMPVKVHSQGGMNIQVKWNHSKSMYYELSRAGTFMFLNHFWTGVGLGNHAIYLADYMDQRTIDPENIYSTPESRRQFTPHGFYVGWLAETGMIGMIAFFLFFGMWLFQLQKYRRRISEEGRLFWSLAIGLLILGFMGNLMFSRVFWIFLAMTASYFQTASSRSQEPL